MRAWMMVLFISLSGMTILLCSANADELHLSNGDSLTGQVVRMEDNQLVFKTSYAGEIKVQWPDVINLVTDDPIKAILVDGTVLEGYARQASDHMMRLETEKLEAPSDFKLSEVAAINPVKKPDVKITTRVNIGVTQERGNTDTDSIRLDGTSMHCYR